MTHVAQFILDFLGVNVASVERTCWLVRVSTAAVPKFLKLAGKLLSRVGKISRV